jgi:hypothetical protein
MATTAIPNSTKALTVALLKNVHATHERSVVRVLKEGGTRLTNASELFKWLLVEENISTAAHNHTFGLDDKKLEILGIRDSIYCEVNLQQGKIYGVTEEYYNSIKPEDRKNKGIVKAKVHNEEEGPFLLTVGHINTNDSNNWLIFIQSEQRAIETHKLREEAQKAAEALKKATITPSLADKIEKSRGEFCPIDMITFIQIKPESLLENLPKISGMSDGLTSVEIGAGEVKLTYNNGQETTVTTFLRKDDTPIPTVTPTIVSPNELIVDPEKDRVVLVFDDHPTKPSTVRYENIRAVLKEEKEVVPEAEAAPQPLAALENKELVAEPQATTTKIAGLLPPTSTESLDLRLWENLPNQVPM